MAGAVAHIFKRNRVPSIGIRGHLKRIRADLRDGHRVDKFRAFPRNSRWLESAPMRRRSDKTRPTFWTGSGQAKVIQRLQELAYPPTRLLSSGPGEWRGNSPGRSPPLGVLGVHTAAVTGSSVEDTDEPKVHIEPAAVRMPMGHKLALDLTHKLDVNLLQPLMPSPPSRGFSSTGLSSAKTS